MISGTHTVIFTKNSEVDRAFFRDVLKLNSTDFGDGWLIFALPPSEVGMHPTDNTPHHEMYLMCDSITDFVHKLKAHGITCKDIEEMPWGKVSSFTLPGGSELGVYEPNHQRPVYGEKKRL